MTTEEKNCIFPEKKEPIGAFTVAYTVTPVITNPDKPNSCLK